MAYLQQRPYDNVYVAWLLATKQVGRDDDVLLWRDEAGAIAGLGLIGARLIPIGDRSDVIAGLAQSAVARVRDPRLILGRKTAVDAFWSHASASMPVPYVRRAHQPVYALTKAPPSGLGCDVDVAAATIDEVEELAHESAKMTSGEMSYPVLADAGFVRRTARIVRAGWWWRYRVAGKLVFMCHIGAATEHTAQIQGVWTPEAMRGGGYATIGLAAICARILQDVPSVCLYVNDFNTRAIALYERLGFARVSEFSTILFA